MPSTLWIPWIHQGWTPALSKDAHLSSQSEPLWISLHLSQSCTSESFVCLSVICLFSHTSESFVLFCFFFFLANQNKSGGHSEWSEIWDTYLPNVWWRWWHFDHEEKISLETVSVFSVLEADTWSRIQTLGNKTVVYRGMMFGQLIVGPNKIFKCLN